MLVELAEETQCASDDQSAHRVPDETQLEWPFDQFQVLRDFDRQSPPHRQQTVLRFADVGRADVHLHPVPGLQAGFHRNEVVSVGLEAMHEEDNVLVGFRNCLRSQNAAGLINLFEYFDRLLRILEIASIFNGENCPPKFLFGLALLPDRISLFEMGARHVVVAVEGPIIIFDPMAENIGLHPFAKLVLIFGLEDEGDGLGV